MFSFLAMPPSSPPSCLCEMTPNTWRGPRRGPDFTHDFVPPPVHLWSPSVHLQSTSGPLLSTSGPLLSTSGKVCPPPLWWSPVVGWVDLGGTNGSTWPGSTLTNAGRLRLCGVAMYVVSGRFGSESTRAADSVRSAVLSRPAWGQSRLPPPRPPLCAPVSRLAAL